MSRLVDYYYIIELLTDKKYDDLLDEDYFLIMRSLLIYACKASEQFYSNKTSNRKVISMLAEWRQVLCGQHDMLSDITFEIEHPTEPKIYYDRANSYWSDESDSQFLIEDYPYEEVQQREFDSREAFLEWFQQVRPDHKIFKELNNA